MILRSLQKQCLAAGPTESAASTSAGWEPAATADASPIDDVEGAADTAGTAGTALTAIGASGTETVGTVLKVDASTVEDGTVKGIVPSSVAGDGEQANVKVVMTAATTAACMPKLLQLMRDSLCNKCVTSVMRCPLALLARSGPAVRTALCVLVCNMLCFTVRHDAVQAWQPHCRVDCVDAGL